MQTTAPPPLPAPPVPVRSHPAPPPPRPAARRHARPAPGGSRPAALAVLVLVVGLAATAVALVLPSRATEKVDTALAQLRGWPSITVDGVLSPGGGTAEPVDVHATVTADGFATGTLTRPDGGRAELAAAPGATLLRGDRRWWHDRPPALVVQLTHRWISGARGGAVDRIGDGGLTPAAVSDALTALRDPTGRTVADAEVGGVPGTSFTRDGLRLVVDRDGRPVAVDLPVPGADLGDAPLGPDARPAPRSTLSLAVSRPEPGDATTARRAVGDVLAGLGASRPDHLPSLDEILQREARAAAAPPVAVEVAAERGCRPARCRVRVTLANTRPTPTSGLFVLEVAGRVVESGMMTLAPLRETALTVELPEQVLSAVDGPRIPVEASFDPTVGQVTNL